MSRKKKWEAGPSCFASFFFFPFFSSPPAGGAGKPTHASSGEQNRKRDRDVNTIKKAVVFFHISFFPPFSFPFSSPFSGERDDTVPATADRKVHVAGNTMV